MSLSSESRASVDTTLPFLLISHMRGMLFTMEVPPDGAGVRKHRRMANAVVPRDDESTWHIQWFFDETQPIYIAYRVEEGGHWVDENYRKLLNIDS